MQPYIPYWRGIKQRCCLTNSSWYLNSNLQTHNKFPHHAVFSWIRNLCKEVPSQLKEWEKQRGSKTGNVQPVPASQLPAARTNEAGFALLTSHSQLSAPLTHWSDLISLCSKQHQHMQSQTPCPNLSTWDLWPELPPLHSSLVSLSKQLKVHNNLLTVMLC